MISCRREELRNLLEITLLRQQVVQRRHNRLLVREQQQEDSLSLVLTEASGDAGQAQ